MTDNEQHIENLKKLRSFHNGSFGTSINAAIKALEQQSDTVPKSVYMQVARERDIAIEQLNELGYEFGEKIKTGHWIKDDITERSKSAYKHKCDRCGAYHRAMYDYCPSCGARMFDPQESEE